MIVIIFTEYHIFATSVYVRNGTLDLFLLRLKNMIAIRRTIAAETNRVDTFAKSWAKLLLFSVS